MDQKMKSKIIATVSIAAYVGVGLFLFGCASRPKNAPSTAAVTGDIARAQTATQQADAKATVILDYLKSE